MGNKAEIELYGGSSFPGRKMSRLSLYYCGVIRPLPRLYLSRNRFTEIPGDICQLVSLESLNLYHNCLRSVPLAICNLQVLTYLNISRNLITSLPPYLCRLPLTVLVACNNRLTTLPEELGAMTSLRQLDVSCNEIQILPSKIGSLVSLRELNVRRNQLSTLPEELSELPLTRLDFSCNRVTHIPVCYRHLRHLQTILLDNNPLQFPPAQICLKGKAHIFKYLNVEACSKARSDHGGLGKLSRPTSFTTCLTDDIYSSRPYGGLDSGFNSVDSGSKRWSGNESTDEFSELSFRIAGLGRDAKQFPEKHNGIDGDTEHADFMDSSTNEEEEDAKSDCGLQMTITSQEKREPEHHSTPRAEKTIVCGSAPSPLSVNNRPEYPIEERRRPETLLIWRERERQQLQQKQESTRRQSVDKKDSMQKIVIHPSTNHPPVHCESSSSPNVCSKQWNQGCQSISSNPTSPTSLATDQSVCLTHKPNSFLFRSYSRGALRSAQGSEQSTAGSSSPVRLRVSRPPPDEKSLLDQLRKDIETHLNTTLQEPLCESLSNGVILCQLLNHLRPRTIASIHVPSPAVPKLNAVKSRRNVDSFLDACRRLGIPEQDLCLASDLLGGEHSLNVYRTVSSLLRLTSGEAALASPAFDQGASPCPPQPSPLSNYGGFLLFYALLMLILYAAYSKLYVF
ncbi:leucine-rich repeat and calponin homology domain-containing 4 [Pelobates cultripes]|uniref:Leucine-rich repeat and calponin homology domain-containing 4 n=1 Tax=Pelobates cultripes TaxID=61616 RepID=A0AAD1VXG3_PELCU|nr:leucine-rich repeat and calponin homology domain-containing 4 [Pelobates cultripes]